MDRIPPLTADDPRLLALALGEIRDPAERASLEADIAADPQLAAGFERLRAFAGTLRTEARREPLPFVNPAEIVARATGAPKDSASARRRASGGLGGSLSGTRAADRDASRSRLIVFGGLGAAAAACLALSLSLGGGSAVSDKPVVNAVTEKQPGMLVSTNRRYDLASLAASLPSLAGAGDTFAPAGRAPLALAASDAKPYLAAFSRELAAGRRPVAERIRVDGLVNAFIGAHPAAPGSRPVLVETALTETPWNAGHRLLRVTVRAQGAEGTVVAKNAVASVDFNPAAVKSWRVLGYAGSSKASETVALRGGDTVTTLYEIETTGDAPANLADITVRYARADRPVAESVAVSLGSDKYRVLADSDADTRFAAGLAAYALDLGDNPVAGLALAAADNPDRRAFAALAR